MNQKKYRAACLQNFCEGNCALDPCPKGSVRRLCHIYCHDIALPNGFLQKKMRACFLKGYRHFYASPKAGLRNIADGHKDFEKLKQVCSERDVLFHVDGLHSGSKGMVRIPHFEANIEKAIQLTFLAHKILRKISLTTGVPEIESQAKAFLEKSDQHAQYFASVTGDMLKMCLELKAIVEFGYIHGTENYRTAHPIHENIKRNAYQHMVDLMEIRDKLFAIDCITLTSGGIVRIPNFMDNVKHAISLSYSINRLYAHLSRTAKLTPAHKDHFMASNRKVISFVNSVYSLDQKNQDLIRALASGETYHP